MKQIEQVNLGDVITYKEWITEKLHQGFIDLSGDDSPIHTDAIFCQSTMFKKPIGHAFLLTTILSKIYGKIYPGGSELCLEQTCQFKKPFYVGDELTFTLKVTQKNQAFQLITIATEVTNQLSEVIFIGECKMRLCLGN